MTREPLIMPRRRLMTLEGRNGSGYDKMATNYAKATYNEIYDFGTKSGKTTIMGIHTPSVVESPTVSGPYRMLNGFFQQFRKFRYCGCRVTLIPAAQLPADPLQVSFEAGQPTIDPRDLLNPILFHGCHGESLNIALNAIFAKSGTVIDTPSLSGEEIDTTALVGNEYYSALSDNTWRKFGVQNPAKLPFLHPMVHKVGTTFPMVGAVGSMDSYTTMQELDSQLKALGQPGLSDNVIHDGAFFNPPIEWRAKKFGNPATDVFFSQHWMTNGLQSLGWLPTSVADLSDGTVSTTNGPDVPHPLVPKLYMGVLMFPPSYTQELYFRMTITHYFEFKDFQGVSLGMGLPSAQYFEDLPEIGGKSIDLVGGDEPVLTTSGVA
ncbi:MAG: capsid protein [Smacoviridae sp.]|uniref:Capsid protein n=1 Tax=Smacoviridae sp. TaxID=2715094 RepID=A0A6G8R5F8_9VIRU|nr:MAG: capsid protein [Smacoviridae sp.]QIN96630.1 MAG: capsid protein [Smacoviridae sp.]